MHDELLTLLTAADGIPQGHRWHPERDLLDHLLQTWRLARVATEDPCLRAAALLHDIGKVVASEGHARIGADLLQGLISPRVVWLVRHHDDLLRAPRSTRRRLRGSDALADLERLRSWDKAGRAPGAAVDVPVDVVNDLLGPYGWTALDPASGEPAPMNDDERKEDD